MTIQLHHRGEIVIENQQNSAEAPHETLRTLPASMHISTGIKHAGSRIHDGEGGCLE